MKKDGAFRAERVIFVLLIGIICILTGCADKGDSQIGTCTVTICCETALEAKDVLAQEKYSALPKDGILLQSENVPIQENDSVYDVFIRAAQKASLSYEVSDGYLSGIGGLYQMDCGELSGWLYSVNGEFQIEGADNIPAEDGMEIAWLYTCDMGADVGASFS